MLAGRRAREVVYRIALFEAYFDARASTGAAPKTKTAFFIGVFEGLLVAPFYHLHDVTFVNA